MSATALDLDPFLSAPARPTTLPDRDDERRLRAIERPSAARRPKLLYGLVAVAGALAIAGAQMGLSILTTQGSYEVKELTSQQRAIEWQQQMLQDDVAGLSSPQYLAATAADLGMVIAGAPSYLRLSDGEVIGAGKKASGSSSVEALKKAAVPNDLLSDKALVTSSGATLGSADARAAEVVTTTIPPAVADGLPTPKTH